MNIHEEFGVLVPEINCQAIKSNPKCVSSPGLCGRCGVGDVGGRLENMDVDEFLHKPLCRLAGWWLLQLSSLRHDAFFPHGAGVVMAVENNLWDAALPPGTVTVLCVERGWWRKPWKTLHGVLHLPPDMVHCVSFFLGCFSDGTLGVASWLDSVIEKIHVRSHGCWPTKSKKSC